ncbi:MAG: RnfH family protein [Rhodocyclaceae bacterium]|nr:MAG: RnfH family protein [Rhodocyclaceae bacterium]
MVSTPNPRAGTGIPDAEPGADGDDDFVEVEVIYAVPQRFSAIQLRLPPGSTLRQAIDASGIVRQFPEIDLAKCKLGICGKLARADTVLSAQDRIEIYRPLLADPKDIRKQRAAAGVKLQGKPKQ